VRNESYKLHREVPLEFLNLVNHHGEHHLGCAVRGAIYDLTRANAHEYDSAPALFTIDDVITGGDATFHHCQSVVDQFCSDVSYRADMSDFKIISPVLSPRQIIAVGRNYSDHVNEAALDLPSLPRLFAKWPSTIVATGESIIKPRETRKLDWEVELAVVIGRPATKVSRDEALLYVFGYTILNDVSARDIQMEVPEQLTLGKNFRTFSPIGDRIVTADDIPDPKRLMLRAWLNEGLVQQSLCEHMIFDVPELISFISHVLDLIPGDVISTGTPAGSGHFRKPPIYLKNDDRLRMEMSLEGRRVCVLENSVKDEFEVSTRS
jgi:2-keto-4-pentenoate hydratase/2-oxohepta-3-ene-1,7-dioic acid hydratase in catechol pathway